MSFDKKFLEKIISEHEKNSLIWTLHLFNKKFLLDQVSVLKISNTISGPTSREGIYLSDYFSYKIIGKLSDTSIIPLLSKTMLGPNTKFKDLKIKTTLPIDGNLREISLIAHLTNSVQKSSIIELHLIINQIAEN